MKRRLAGTTIGLALVALVTTAVALAAHDRQSRSARLGAIIARDSARDNPAAAVARVTLSRGEIGKLSFRIKSVPKRTKVDWGITTRCVKGSLIDYFPGPGDFKTGTKPGGFGGKFPLPLADPDFCTFAVAGQTFKHEAGKRVTVKIYNKR